MTKPPIKSHQIPVTVEMLESTRNELIQLIEKRNQDMERRICNTENKRQETEQKLKSEILQLSNNVYRQQTLTEEQNARNIYVLDMLNILFLRQERIEQKMDSISPENL